MRQAPSKKLKFFFWIILGVLSIAFVEVTTGSQLFPFFTPGGILLILPVYFFHIVLLATGVFRYGKPRIWTLYAAGMIFGMYEAYITKVLWKSYSAEGPPIVLGGVGVIETIVLVLVAHSLFAFIIPLFFAENMLTKSRDINRGLTDKTKDRLKKHGMFFLIFLMIYFGFTQAAPNPLFSLASGLGATLVVGVLVFIWRKKTQGLQYTMEELLPSKKVFKVFIVLTLIMYLLFGFFFDPEYLPGLQGHITILILYAILFFILIKSLKKSKRVGLGKYIGTNVKFSWKLLVGLGLIFSVSAALFNILLAPFGGIKFIIIILLYMVVGFTLLIKVVRDTFRKD